MCALIGAPDRNSFIDILNVNRYRGEVTHSLCDLEFDKDSRIKILRLMRNQGSFNTSAIVDSDKCALHIGHTQAPTSGSSNIHPATYKGSYLWHNGIVKQHATTGWDTQLIIEGIVNHGFSTLSEIDGTFACFLLMDDRLYVFRNEISPLFHKDGKYYSSTKMEGMISLEPNTVFAVEPLSTNTLRFVTSFKTKENPYFFTD